MNSLPHTLDLNADAFDMGSGWTLFLDRDGVINQKIDHDYVKSTEDFVFLENAVEGIVALSRLFERIIVVTNQRGVGRGLMTEADLSDIHRKMCHEVSLKQGRIDKIYYCTATDSGAHCRKPNTGMGLQAKQDFPEIDFTKSIILGDSMSDMEFGRNLGMFCFLVNNKSKDPVKNMFDARFNSLFEAAQYLQKIRKQNNN